MDYTNLGTPSPEWLEFLTSAPPLNVPAIVPGSDAKLARQLTEESRGKFPSPPKIDQVDIVDFTIPTNDAFELPARLYFPEKVARQKLPLFYYLHGGGFLYGSIESDDHECRLICTRNQIAVLSINYRHTDTHPYPTQHEDSYCALKYIHSLSAELGIDGNRIIVGGESAGANLAVATVLRAVRESIPVLGQVLSSPLLCHPKHFPHYLMAPEKGSHKQHALGPVLTREELIWYIDLLQLPISDCTTISPLLLPKSELIRLPRTYIQVCGMDPLRDDGMLFLKSIKDSGVFVSCDIYPGLPHAFHHIFILASAEKYNSDLDRNIQWLLGNLKKMDLTTQINLSTEEPLSHS